MRLTLLLQPLTKGNKICNNTIWVMNMKIIHFGNLIRRLRIKRGISLYELSTRCKLAAGYIWGIEMGFYYPPEHYSQRILVALHD